MTIKTRLSRAEAAASSPAHDAHHATIETHRQEILARIESGRMGYSLPSENESGPVDWDELQRLIDQIVAERKQHEH